MSKVSVHEAKAHFSELLRRVEAGETMIVTRHNTPVVEIRPIVTPTKIRSLGVFDGELEISDEAFAPLTDEELKDWDGD